jgi:4-hydroxy-tetrahydrodipicolinate synthase
MAANRLLRLEPQLGLAFSTALTPEHRRTICRRQALGAMLGGAFALSARGAEKAEFRGVYPIVQTPYTAAGGVDFEALEAEVKFLDKTGVHGIVWPQRASQYQYLSFEERIEGAERIAAANEGLRPKLVIGVQGPDTPTAVRYAKHAQKLKPDAIIALPTRDQGQFNLDEVLAYYEAVANACDLPLFVQTTGNMSVEFVLKMAERIPTLRYIKDEAGDPIQRLEEFRAATKGGPPYPFTGSHGRTLYDELLRGVAGNMPASGWVELYVDCWDHFHSGRHGEAIAALSKALMFVEQAVAYGFPALSYVLHLRGVFPRYDVRGGLRPLDDAAKQALRATYEYVKPSLRG